MRPRRGTLRFRIALAFFLGAFLVSGMVAASTYALAGTFLARQRTDLVVRQSFNGLRFANEYLTRPEGSRDLDQLVTFLQSRGTSDVLVTDGTRSVASSVSITERTIPVELRRSVGSGEVGYLVFAAPGAPRRLAFGSPVPNADLDAYFVYSLADLDQTMGVLARILVGVVAGAALVAGAAGFRVSRRVVQPVRRASEAAQRVAEGLLETRLEESGRDEVGLMAASFNTMAEALQERIARERRFVADASHELRTPLTALKTSVDYLVERMDELPPRLGSAVEVAAEEVRSLQRLVGDLLELSRMEAGGVQVHREDVELGAFVAQVARRRAPGRHVRIEAPTPVVVRTDKARLERVVGNLLENAVVHGGGKGVALEVEDGDDEVCVVVSDQGPGIPPDQVGSIFERFWRADQARQRGGRTGAGLGLAIVRENAAVLGAEVEVESSPERGTRFTVRVPRDPVSRAGGTSMDPAAGEGEA